MRKPKIILDCDDVLFNTNEVALEHQNKKYGTSYSIEDLSKWGLTGNEILDESATISVRDGSLFVTRSKL